MTRWMEPISFDEAQHQRRLDIYEKLADMTGNHIKSSEDLITFFLTCTCALTHVQHKMIGDDTSTC